ncbi:pectate lyase [uncultured Draconibacterium sp.]|uniref:pectate lyase n=1 Tax=uncultured Draconibacterium sp. TaxID=1573823 RepID=UPI0025D55F90|nr:pectate lyase [uncultured Draconibacterium sp.]
MNFRKLYFLVALAIFAVCANGENLKEDAKTSLKKGVSFFYSINSHGGYVYYVTPDLKIRWGEGIKDENTIEVQPPGTPSVGQAFLRAYQVSKDETALKAAKDAATALVRGQNKFGGWEHTVNFNKISHEKVSFDDNQCQSAISFLMALDQEIEDESISGATKKALDLMLTAQLDNGAWPHIYPEQGNYHDYATYNDGGINDCVRVMLEAHNYYGNSKEIEKSLKKAIRFIYISQLPPPQSGWAQQYNEFLQPAWARTFEPPSVCPLVTVLNINTLIDLYLVLGDDKLLEPIPDAIRWLKDIKMENGKWARFVELGTNKALYYDRPRIRCETLEDLHPERRTGYRYQVDIADQLQESELRYKKALELGHKGLWDDEHSVLNKEQIMKRLEVLSEQVIKIMDSQEPSGAWITKNDRFKKQMPKGIRWNGQYEVMDRISSEVFNENVAILCEYIELSNRIENKN